MFTVSSLVTRLSRPSFPARAPQEVEQGWQIFEGPILETMWEEYKAEGLIRADAPTPIA